MRLKTILCASLSAVLLCASPAAHTTATATAATVSYSIVNPLYEIAHEVWGDLYINGSTATCASKARAGSAVKITCDQYLQKQGFLWIWSTYDDAEWTETVNSDNITVLNTKTDLTSGKYRLKTIFTLTNSQGKTEKVTVYSNEKTVG